MTKRIALLSVACGIAWHMMLIQLMGGSFLDAFSGRLLPSVAAGLAAGYFTIWSRERRAGREAVLDVIVTYYLAVAVYILLSASFTAIFEIDHAHVGERLVFVFFALGYSAFVATVLGVVLIPLCFATRHLLWRLRGADADQLHNAAGDASHRS